MVPSFRGRTRYGLHRNRLRPNPERGLGSRRRHALEHRTRSRIGVTAAAIAESALIVAQRRGAAPDATAFLAALDPATSAETLRFATDGVAPSSPLVIGETVYAASDSGELVYAVDTTTGVERWSRPVGSGRVLAATVEMVLVEGNALYALLLG